METREGYKKTELGWIPKGWGFQNLGDVCSFNQGIQIPYNEQINSPKEGYIRYLYIRDFFSNTHCCYVKDIYPNKIMNEDDIMMVNTGNTAGAVYSGAYGVLSNNAFKFIFDKNILSRDFLFHFLKSFYLTNFLNKLYNKAGQPHVGHKNISKVPFILPPLPEQQKIAEILTTVDDKISSIQDQIKQTEQLKKGLMEKLLTEGIGHTEFKDTEIGRIPKGWDVVKLGDISEFRNGKAHENVIDDFGKYIVVNSKYISSDGNVVKKTNQNLCPLYRGEIVMVMSDVPNGKAFAKCYIIDKDDTFSLNQRICSIRPTKTDIKFLYNVINRNRYYLQYDNGVSQTNLKKSEVLDCPIPLPILEEQQQIATILSSVDDKLDILQSKKTSYETLKKGLMEQLLTGKRRVTLSS